MKYGIPKRVFLVKKFFDLKKISLVQRSFRSEYPNQGTPSHTTINNLISYFEKTGTVTPKLVSEFPNLSIRKEITFGTSWRRKITKKG